MEKSDREHSRNGLHSKLKSGPFYSEQYALDNDLVSTDSPHKPCRTRLPLQDGNSSQSSGYSSQASAANYSYSDRLNPTTRNSQRDSLASTCSSDQGSVFYHFTGCNVHFNGTDSPRIGRSPGNWDGSTDDSEVSRDKGMHLVGIRHDVLSPQSKVALDSYTPSLVDGIDPLSLLPYLSRHGLVNKRDHEIIANETKSTTERNLYIVRSVPYKCEGAFDLFVQSLEEAENHPRHCELAKLLKEKIPSQQPDSQSSGHITHRSQSSKDMLGRHADRGGKTYSDMRKSSAYASGRNSQEKKRRSRNRYSSKSDSASDTPSDDQSLTGADRKAKASPTQCYTSAPVSTSETLEIEKLQWLQDSVDLRGYTEEITFASLTNYNAKRRILHDGVVFHDGKPVFLVLFNDFLLILCAKGPSNSLGGQDFVTYAWFSDNTYVGDKPHALHLLHISKHDMDDGSQHYSFTLRYRSSKNSLQFAAFSRRARDVWINTIKRAVEECTNMREKHRLPTKPEAPGNSSAGKCWTLAVTVVEAANLILPEPVSGAYTLFCIVKLGTNKAYRTLGVLGSDCTSWNAKFEFSDFSTRDMLEIQVVQENLFCPNYLIGSVVIPIVETTPFDLHENHMEDFLTQDDEHIYGKIKFSIGFCKEISV